MLARLTTEFTESQLEEARVCFRDENNELRLSPPVAGNPSPFLIFRRSKQAQPFDLVNQRGSLASDDPPIFSCREDYFTNQFVGRSGRIIAGLSDNDMALLRQLGLPCAPACGLDRMNGQQAKRLLDPSLDGNDRAHVARTNSHIYLVGMQIANLSLEKPALLEAVVRTIRDAVITYRKSSSQHIHVWDPKPDEFDRLCSAVRFSDRQQIRQVIWESMNYSSMSIAKYFEKHMQKQSDDYIEARRELLDAISHARKVGFETPDVREKLALLNQTFDSQVIDAIVRDAMSSRDPVDRSLLILASDLMRHWQRSDDMVQISKHGLAAREDLADGVLSSSALKDRLRMVDGIVRIHKELMRGK